VTTTTPTRVARVEEVSHGLGLDLACALLVGTGVGGLLIALGGRVPGALGLGVCCALALAALTRPFPVYQALVFLCLVASAGAGELPVWTEDSGFHFFSNAWKLLWPAETSYSGLLVLEGFEIVMLGLVAGVGLRIARGRDRLAATADLWPVALFGAGVFGMFAYGLATGGAPKPALWQVRPYLHLVALTLLTPQVLRTRAQIRTTLWTLAIATCVKALETLWVFVFYRGARFGGWRELVSHEASIFFVGVIALSVALLLYRTGGRQRTFLLVAMPLLLAALILNLRRTGYVALAMSLAAIPLLLHGRRRAALRWAVPMVALLAVYAAVFWNHTGNPLGYLLAKAKSVAMAQPGTTDSMSNLYRLGENYNLRRTIADHPLGLGFGHPFEIHHELPQLPESFVNWDYHPHNQLLGLWMSLGPVGFAFLLIFVGSVMMLAAHEIRRQSDPYAKALCFFVLASVASAVFATAVDMFLWAERGATFAAIVVGMLFALRAVEARDGGWEGA
jgi:O-antigen ligase